MKCLNITLKLVFILFWQALFLASYAQASLVSVPSQTHQTTPITVQLNWNHQYQFAGFYAAIKQGYYQQAGLDVTVKSWQPGINVVDEVVSGRADFATGYSSIIADYAKGKPLSLVMVSFQYSPMVMLSHEPITDLNQLAGKSIMHFGNLQIQGLIDKVSSVANQNMIEIDSSGDINDFVNRKVDFYAAYQTNEPYRLTQKGVPFYTVDPKTFGIQSYGDLIFTSQDKARYQPEVLNAFRKATIQGWEYAVTNQAVMADYILAHYPVKKDLPALLAEAEATTQFVKSGNIPIGTVEQGKLMGSAVQAKESGLLTQAQLDNLDLNGFLFRSQTLSLTPEEVAYLTNNPVIKVGNDLSWEPFDFVDEKGRRAGMAAEYFTLFEAQLGVTFDYNINKKWFEILSLAKQGDIDVLSSVVATPDRQAYMNFTAPYLSFPMVLATLKEVSFIGDVQKITGRKVAVVNGYWSHEKFKTDYPEVELLVVDTLEAGLQAVQSGQADAYSGNLATINFGIKKYGLTGLHISGQLDGYYDLSIGVQKDNPILFSILGKALSSVTEQQRNQIYNNWLKLEVVTRVDRTLWIKTILIVGSIILALIVLIVFLQMQKRRQETYINRINELSLATYTNVETHKMEWVSDSFAALSGYTKAELLNQQQDVLRHPDIDPSFYNHIWAEIQAGHVWQGEVQAKAKNGAGYWIDAVVTPDVVNEKVKGFWTTRTNISDKKHLEELSIRDALTGTFNRHYFNEMFESELNRASRKQAHFAMATFDIDFFKQINDHYGHQKGDEVLKQVVNVVSKHAQRAGDLLFRVGGEEFMVFSDLQSSEAFLNYLEQLRKAVASLAIPNPKAELNTLSISIGGVFCHRAEQTTSSALYAMADKALYEAKDQGRNKVVMHVI